MFFSIPLLLIYMHFYIYSAFLTENIKFSSVQLLSCVQLFATLWICSTPRLPVHHQLPEFTQIHVHQVSDAIQPSHPLSSPSPPAPNPSQLQGLFQWVNSSHEVGSFFLIHSDSFYLFIGTYRPFMFKMIIGCIRIISTIFVTIFYLLSYFFFYTLPSFLIKHLGNCIFFFFFF